LAVPPASGRVSRRCACPPLTPRGSPVHVCTAPTETANLNLESRISRVCASQPARLRSSLLCRAGPAPSCAAQLRKAAAARSRSGLRERAPADSAPESFTPESSRCGRVQSGWGGHAVANRMRLPHRSRLARAMIVSRSRAHVVPPLFPAIGDAPTISLAFFFLLFFFFFFFFFSSSSLLLVLLLPNGIWAAEQ